MPVRLPETTGTDRISPLRFILLLISGLLIGGGAILPGISGGVLCVVFGVYRPMMELLSHPIAAFPKYWRLFLPVVAGWVPGFLGFARIVEIVFAANELFATWLFIGLIAGTFPALYQQAGQQGRPRAALISLFLAFALLMSVLCAVRFSPSVSVAPSFPWFVFAGVLWGLSLIVPGMTSSSILMSLDLYTPLASGIADLDPAVLLPWILGMALTAATLSRLISHLFAKRYACAFHAVIGVVLASTLAIIPLRYDSIGQLLLSLLCFAAGAAAAWLMDRLDRLSKDRTAAAPHENAAI